MNKFMLSFLAVCFLACTPAELAKTEAVVAKVVQEVKCRAEVLKPYMNTVTKEKIKEILVSDNAGEMLKETLDALEEDPAAVVKVVESMAKCKFE